MDRIDEESSCIGYSAISESKKPIKDPQETGSQKDRASDRFIPIRCDDESRNFYELSCSLSVPEEAPTAANSQAIEREEEEKSCAIYSSYLAKKIFNFRLNCTPSNVIDHENMASQSQGQGSLATGESSTLLGGSSTPGLGLSFSGAFSNAPLSGGSAASLILSRGSKAGGFGKILKYRNDLKETCKGQNRFLQVCEDDFINFDEILGESDKSLEPNLNAIRILEAPGLKDDFYYNLIDWGKQNVMAVALANKMYLWNASTAQVAVLSEMEDPQHCTSVQWSPSGSTLSLGLSNGEVEIWDLAKMKKILSNDSHTLRVSNMQWIDESHLASSSRDRTIALFDIRADRITNRLKNHKQEVCGLRWSSGCELLASGGNEYRICVWSLHKSNPVYCMNYHKSAVKALDWNPHQRGILLSGGGNSDKTIKVFNTFSGRLVKELNVGNQVCNIRFSRNSNHFVSTHGFTKNDIGLWRYETLEQTARLEGHSNRVLYMCTSPDQETIATAAGDEVIKFWKVFPQEKKETNRRISPSSLFLR